MCHVLVGWEGRCVLCEERGGFNYTSGQSAQSAGSCDVLSPGFIALVGRAARSILIEVVHHLCHCCGKCRGCHKGFLRQRSRGRGRTFSKTSSFPRLIPFLNIFRSHIWRCTAEIVWVTANRALNNIYIREIAACGRVRGEREVNTKSNQNMFNCFAYASDRAALARPGHSNLKILRRSDTNTPWLSSLRKSLPPTSCHR